MATVLVVVADVRPHEPDQMALAEDHDVREELAPTAADPALGGSVLPRTAKRNTERSATVPALTMTNDWPTLATIREAPPRRLDRRVRAVGAGALSSVPSLVAAERGFQSRGRLGADTSPATHGRRESRER